MSILLKQLAAGPKFTIYAMVEVPPKTASGLAEPGAGAGNCPVETFFNQCSQQAIAQLVKRLDHTAQHGPSWNREQCRQLTANIWEFKTGAGLRLLWFYDKGQLIICTSGYLKQRQKADKTEIRRAEEWKAKYDQAKATRQLTVSTENVII